jgi:hypothetical protein
MSEETTTDGQEEIVDNTTTDEQTVEERHAEIREELIESVKEEIEKDEETDSEDADNKPEPDKDKKDSEADSEQVDDKADDIVPALPAMLIEDAVRAGMTLTEANGYKDAVELATVTSALKERLKEPEKEEEKEPEETALDRLLQDEDMDEDLKEVLKVVNEENKKMSESLKTIEKDGKDGKESKQREAQMAYEKEFDTELNGLGEDAKKLLGDGDIYSLTGKEAENRRELYNTVNALGNSYHQSGTKVPELKTLINLAGISLHGDSFKSEKSEIKKQLQKQSQNLINKPGQRTAHVKKPIDGRDEAVDAAETYMKKIGS